MYYIRYNIGDLKKYRVDEILKRNCVEKNELKINLQRSIPARNKYTFFKVNLLKVHQNC